MTIAMLAGVTVLAAVVCVLLIVGLKPWLVRYALARPNARSSHTKVTPQGGGIAVLGGFLLALAIGTALLPGSSSPVPMVALAIAACGLCLIGAVDDIHTLPVLPRMAGQALAVGIALAAIDNDVRLVPEVPLWIERCVALVAGLWFVNLTNFIDGLDWMTVADMVPPAATIAALTGAGWLPPETGLVAAAFLGGLLGFAPFNRPVARLFLGDAGSLPIGLIAAWLLFQVAGSGGFVAAILLALYPCVDATWTVIRRAARREKIWEGHRTHFYQQATTNGFTVRETVARVFILNVVLAILAVLSLMTGSIAAQIGLLLAGCAAVGVVVRGFTQGPRR